MVFCQYATREIEIYEDSNREPKTAFVKYGLLTHISEIKNNLGIGTCIVQIIASFSTQKYDDQHKLWAHALAIYGFSAFAINLKASRSRPNVPRLSGTPDLNVSPYVEKLPNVNGDDILELNAHLAKAPMRRRTMGVDPKTKQASLILMSSFTGMLGH